MNYTVKTKKSSVRLCEVDKIVSAAYDYDFNGESSTDIKIVDKSRLPNDFGIGLITGGSGSGKSTNLLEFGNQEIPSWDNEISLAANFNDFNVARLLLNGVGLNSIRAWSQPRSTLSTGQGYRADIAKTIKNNSVYDEFCSYLDEGTARSLSVSIRKLVDRLEMKGVVLATCRDDITDWLNPDWIFNCDTGDLLIRGACRQRPKIDLKIYPCEVSVWDWFKNHHYLDSGINKGSQCWLAVWNDKPVGFYACLAQPSGTIKNAWRGTRMVVLPEYQGLGISTALSEYVALTFVKNGKRFFAKTASDLLGCHREKSELWKPTSKNKKKRMDYRGGRDNKFSDEHKMKHANRLCYSHEFVGIGNGKQ